MRGAEVIINMGGVAPASAEAPVAEERGSARPSLLSRLGLSSLGDATATTVYVAEEALFCKIFRLPAKTPNLKEAIHFQLGLLVPFPEGSYLYSCTTERQENEIAVTIYALPREHAEPVLEELSGQGKPLAGLYPLSQRYVGRSMGKGRWALLLTGPMCKLLVFEGGRLAERILCPTAPALDECRTLAACGDVYTPAPAADSEFLDADTLLADQPLARDFNMLPAGYRRPDYSKIIIGVLLAANVLALLFFAGIKEYRFQAVSGRVDAEIAKLQPAIKQIGQLGTREQNLDKSIARLTGLGKNPDLILLFSQLTEKMPRSAYLDQIRMEKKTGAIYIHGFADDIGELTASLQGVGEVQLKSTSRRNNKNYFQVEINLP